MKKIHICESVVLFRLLLRPNFPSSSFLLLGLVPYILYVIELYAILQ